MNQQPPQQSNGGQGQGSPGQSGQQQQHKIVLQPQQIHTLTETYRSEIAKANEAGNQTEEGQEHLRRAKRIRSILVRFQEQQRAQRQAQNGAAASPASDSSNGTPVMQQGTPAAHQVPAISRQQSAQSVPQVPQQVGSNVSLQNAANQAVMGRQQASQQQQQQHQFSSRQGSQTNQPSNTQLQGNAVPQQAQQQNQQPGAQQPNANILQLQKIKKILDDFQGRLRAIETTKRSGTLGPEELARLTQQEDLLKQRFEQYTRAAVQLSQQLQLRRAQAAAAGGIPQQGTPAGIPQQQQQGQSVANNQAQRQQIPANVQQQSQAAQQQARTSIPRSNSQLSQAAQQQQMLAIRQQQLSQQAAQRASAQSPANVPQAQAAHSNSFANNGLQQQQQPQQQQQQQQQQQPGAAGLNARTPAGRSASPGQSVTPVTSVNAAARPSGPPHGQAGLGTNAATSVVKSPVPTIPVSSSINVPAPQPAIMKGSRPTSLGGGAFNSMALSQPVVYKLPHFEMEGDRVLHKRKLKELVRSVGSDEGDGETTIDGDVEELLLDLADEFVTNVTSFACRLAKHRKVDNIDVKDIQLHLEKNWNIRIPGYSSDEIRSTRRFQPTAAHNQKIAGVEIARSVKKDGN